MSNQNKKERVASLKQQIQDNHDMEQVGQVWQWESCGVSGTDRCTICGLTVKWGRGGQNTGSYVQYLTSKGNEITLSEASRMECD